MVWAGKQIQYYPIFPTLTLSRWRPLSYRNWFLYDNGLRLERVKVSLEAIFSEMIGTNEKVFIFWPGNCSMNVLYPSPLKSFVLSICSRDSMKTQLTDIFTVKCLAGCSHDGSLEDYYWAFHPFEVDKMSTRNFGELGDKK